MTCYRATRVWVATRVADAPLRGREVAHGKRVSQEVALHGFVRVRIPPGQLTATLCPRGEMEIMRGYEPRVGGSNPPEDTTALVVKRKSFEPPKLESRVRFSPRAQSLRALGADEPHKLGLDGSNPSAATTRRARSLGRPTVLQTDAAGFDSLARYHTRSWRNW